MRILNPYISICIPAYKRPERLDRLFQSISIQTFTNFEIIITDDSPDNILSQTIQKYRHLPISYYKNNPALGTPANWNFGISKAKGKWIKLMHDDDCFTTDTALEQFNTAIEKYPDTHFFFCAYANVPENAAEQHVVRLNSLRWNAVKRNPTTLLANNLVGPPSVTLHKNDPKFNYDENVKWVVDMEFYIRYFQEFEPVYIDEVLIEVGINEMQVTNYTFGKPDVQLRENLYLLNKVGSAQLKNMIVFDAWWRMLRNFNIKSVAQLKQTGYSGAIPESLEKIIEVQKKLPAAVLRTGIFSKTLMLLCYLALYHSIPK